MDALIKMLRMGKAQRRGANQKKKGAAKGVYRALFLLTGEDLEPEAHLWKRWWSQNRAKFEIPDKPASLSEKQARQWKKLWKKPRREGKKDEPRKRRRKKRDDG